jgi:hypothetical protein
VRPRDEEERPVELGHLVEEEQAVGDARRGHPVLLVPEGVVLMPVPQVAAEGRLGVDFKLVDVHVSVEQLARRVDEARVFRQAAEHVVLGVRAVDGANHLAVLLGHARLVAPAEDLRQLALDDVHLGLGEAVGEQ